EFVEADQTGEILPPLVVKFDPARETRTRELLTTMHHLVNNFTFPEIPSSIKNKPAITVKDLIEFEDILLSSRA
ncbi:hypothetical protein FWF64_03310, partial [Candidatus Saccharibacteria bacterium]|nr:hypothetical protein [Candidatus Saccharibacteria bacterium]